MATSITFQFWSSNDNENWTGPHSDIADVADSRYIKVKAILSGDATTQPILEDMTIGYFKKSNILADWVYFNYSKEDAEKKEKTWSSKAEFESGTLSNVFVPKGESSLLLKGLQLSGYAEYVFDVGEGKIANWAYHDKSTENSKLILHDDFSENTVSKYTIRGIETYDMGAGPTPNYQSGDKRIYCASGDNKGVCLERNGLGNLTNFLMEQEAYVIEAYADDAGGLGGGFRRQNADNLYTWQWYPSAWDSKPGFQREVSGSTSYWNYNKGGLEYNQWKTFKISSNGSSHEVELSGHSSQTKSDETFGSGTVHMGLWESRGYIRRFKISHYSLPSPVGCNVTFQFWTSDNNKDWTGPHSDIADCANSRYIKVRANFSRDSLAKAMPVLNNMTVGYFLKGS